MKLGWIRIILIQANNSVIRSSDRKSASEALEAAELNRVKSASETPSEANGNWGGEPRDPWPKNDWKARCSCGSDVNLCRSQEFSSLFFAIAPRCWLLYTFVVLLTWLRLSGLCSGDVWVLRPGPPWDPGVGQLQFSHTADLRFVPDGASRASETIHCGQIGWRLRQGKDLQSHWQ